VKFGERVLAKQCTLNVDEIEIDPWLTNFLGGVSLVNVKEKLIIKSWTRFIDPTLAK